MKRKRIIESYTNYYESLPKRQNVLVNSFVTGIIIFLTIVLAEILYFTNIMQQGLIIIYFLPVILISRITPGYRYGVVAIIISNFACDYFITYPRLGFSFSKGFPITLLATLGVTFLISSLTMEMKTQTKLIKEREQRAQLMYDIIRKLFAVRSIEAIIDLAIKHLLGNLKRSVVFYTMDPAVSDETPYVQMIAGHEKADDIFFAEKEKKQVHRIFKDKEAAKSYLLNEGLLDVYYLPAKLKDNLWGVFGIACCGNPLSTSELIYAQMIVDQVALALELQYLSDNQSKIVLESEKEKMRSRLLESISHDFRTPLTSIIGASTAVLEQKNLDRDTCDHLLKDIIDNAEWLVRVVENILTITKLSQESMRVKKTPEAAEEVISHSVSIVRKRFPNCLIHTRIPDKLLIVPMNPTLISQVIINLLENAVKYSPEGTLIFIDLKRQGSFAKFEISDQGYGIPEHLIGNLFDAFAPPREMSSDSSRRMGIGLSICKTIIFGHGGTIEGFNKPEGGAKFIFLLPLEGGKHIES